MEFEPLSPKQEKTTTNEEEHRRAAVEPLPLCDAAKNKNKATLDDRTFARYL